MTDTVYPLAFLAALILIPCAVGWIVGHLTGTEGRRRK